MRLTKEQIHTYRAMAEAYQTHPNPQARGEGERWEDFIDTIDALEAELAAANAALTRLEVVMQRLRGIPAKDGKVENV